MANKFQILKNGQFGEETNESNIDYEFVSPDQFYNETLSLIPFKNAVPSARVFYGEKFYSQAVPLKYREAPHVQALKGDGESFEDFMGKKNGGDVFADADDNGAVVSKVTPNSITYKLPNGENKTKELYSNFAFNRKSGITNYPKVKVGDKISGNQLLANSNYTDDNGTLSLGVNARVALVPYKGWSIDDALVISDSFAKKLTSEHIYSIREPQDNDVKTNKSDYVNLFNDKYTTDQTDKLTDDGVPKVGEILNYGDPIILSTKPKIVSSKDNYLGRLSKFLRGSRADASVIWDKDTPGVVTNVVKGKNGWKINISTEAPAQVGDKTAIRTGSKVTISKIIPDDKMPRTVDGKPIDVLFNQLGLNSRVNAAMVYETLLGKVADKNGVNYKLPSFNKADEKWYDFVGDELNKAGLTDKEYVYDPESDVVLKHPVMVGNAYFLKLYHTSDSKLSARGQGIYDLNQVPLKGGDSGAHAKRLSGLSVYGLLSAGAYDDIKDALNVRGQRNDDYWRQVRMGMTPTLQAKTPFVWDKYLTLLRGAGFNTSEKSNKAGDTILKISPLTDKGFEKIFNPSELQNGEIVNYDDMQPVEGGLFSPDRLVSNGWGKITLDRPYPNPAFEGTITSLLGIKNTQLKDILSGKEQYKNYGTGGTAIKQALSDLDTDALLKESKAMFKDGPRSSQNEYLNKIKYINGLKENNISPDELMIQKVPVLPPIYRPYSVIGDTFIAGDANELYKDLFNVNQVQKAITQNMDKTEADENSMNVYNALKALYGYDETKNIKLKNRNVSGFLDKIIGGVSKYSILNRMVNSKPVDFTGGSVISPDPELGMDEISLPEDMAFELFSPRIQGELSKRGYDLKTSLEAIKNKSDIARNALDTVLSKVPIEASRAPAWHKFNSIGAWAKVHKGKNIYINPLNSTGLNADYDGDTMSIYVPATDKAIEDVKTKLMPSKQVIQIRDIQKIENPLKQDYILGLFNSANDFPGEKSNSYRFNSVQEALAAIRSGKVGYSDYVEVPQ